MNKICLSFFFFSDSLFPGESLDLLTLINLFLSSKKSISYLLYFTMKQ